ncbi:hypothetical protein TOPH_08696 [Tolypocladium ophioglossoides CBS 100239]|uniref:Berberine/berberine-like domain-containing protein n=1 Tax=Tolypocladium ophioglossoides (strain CBS 100239) TaxID=1163406 RepID=A0A0L0MXU4_TOLOC|nr:hypothetical protein TOPH_08696 [Tolypocladium ophioglossoides CBS 100239]
MIVSPENEAYTDARFGESANRHARHRHLGSTDQASFASRDKAHAHLEFIPTVADESKQRSYHHWAHDLEHYLRPLACLKLSTIKRKYDRFDFLDNPLGVPPRRSAS